MHEHRLLDQAVDWPEADRQAFLESIDAQADRLDRVISDVLDLNRIESGSVRPLLKAVDALDLLEEAAERTAITTAGREVSIDGAADLRVTTDSSLIVQAIVNLVENAAKYSPPGSPIRLRTRVQGGDCLLIVEDSGPGIDVAEIGHSGIIGKFRRSASPVSGSSPRHSPVPSSPSARFSGPPGMTPP